MNSEEKDGVEDRHERRWVAKERRIKAEGKRRSKMGPEGKRSREECEEEGKRRREE